MRTLIIFDIPRGKVGKRLRMRMLRKFSKADVRKLQDSVWEMTAKRNILSDVISDFNELRDKIKKESGAEPKFFILKGDMEEL